MGTRAALTAGTVLSVAVTAVWSWTATLAIGPAAPLHLTRDLPGDYMQLAAAPTGNAVALFAVVAAICALCLFVSGLRARRTAWREAAGDLDRAEDAEAAAVSGRGR
jgi:hypothetical protein